MSSTNAPFGFRPIYHPTGLDRAQDLTIATGYAVSIYKGDPVILQTAGVIQIGAAAVDLIGVFDGVEYTDSEGKPTVRNYWLASTAATNITAWVWTDPNIVYEVQSSGAIAATAVGDQADINNISGSTSTGLSTTTLNSSLAGAGAQGQFRIIGLSLDPSQAWSDTYTVVRVQLARSSFVYNKVGV